MSDQYLEGLKADDEARAAGETTPVRKPEPEKPELLGDPKPTPEVDERTAFLTSVYPTMETGAGGQLMSRGLPRTALADFSREAIAEWGWTQIQHDAGDASPEITAKLKAEWERFVENHPSDVELQQNAAELITSFTALRLGRAKAEVSREEYLREMYPNHR